MKLDFNASCVQNGPTLSSKPTPCFLLPIMIKGGKSTIVQTQSLNSRPSTCFIDKELVRQHNLALVEKMTPVVVEMINCQNFSLGPITHETKALMVTIRSHSNKIVFNVISYLKNLVIIGLSWFILHNLQVDWKMNSFHFELVNETTPKYETFPTSTLDSEHDFGCENITKTNQHMQKLKRERNIGGYQGSKHFKPLFVGSANQSAQIIIFITSETLRKCNNPNACGVNHRHLHGKL
jgi:hypothetical protein